MNGAESLIRTALAAGVNVCLANPGTTEMGLVAALDNTPEMRAVLGLFEGVVTGAADGYARMAGKPALTVTHLGPGFANGIANLHNARRARSPLVNIIGDHATWHAHADAPLSSDIVSLARPVSSWLRAVKSANAVAGAVAEAIAHASQIPGRIATLMVPSDCQWNAAGEPAAPIKPLDPPHASADAISQTAQMLRTHGAKSALFIGGRALGARGLKAAGRIAAKSGCGLITEMFPARLERGGGLPVVEKLPYFFEPATAALGRFEAIALAGAASPVTFFGYPKSSVIPDGQIVETLATPDQDVAAALEALAEAVGAPAGAAVAPSGERPAPPTGPLSSATIGDALSALLPEGAIVMDEGVTSSQQFFSAAASCPPHTYLALTGGAIGQGLPCATGAAIACPDRKVIAFQADGSAMYTLQALWTQAREGLNVTTLICSNRRYRILDIELARAGITEPGPVARSLTGLTPPELGWTHLAHGMGVSAVRVETAEDLVRELARALKAPGPNLIEMMI